MIPMQSRRGRLHLTEVRKCGDDHVPLGVDEGLERTPFPLQARLQHSLTSPEMMLKPSVSAIGHCICTELTDEP